MKKKKKWLAMFSLNGMNQHVVSPAVAATGADDELIITGEANVCHVSRVTKVPLVFCL